jgi:copper chaperone CopZ
VTAQTNTLEISISGMHCGSCALLIDDVLADLPGVLMALPSFRTVDPGRECLVCLSFED